MGKTNHLDKKKAKAKLQAREDTVAERAARGPMKQPWTTKRVALLFIIVALCLFMLIPLLAGIFSDNSSSVNNQLNLVNLTTLL